MVHTYLPLQKPEEPSPGRCSPAGQCSTSMSAPWCWCQMAKKWTDFSFALSQKSSGTGSSAVHSLTANHFAFKVDFSSDLSLPLWSKTPQQRIYTSCGLSVQRECGARLTARLILKCDNDRLETSLSRPTLWWEVWPEKQQRGTTARVSCSSSPTSVLCQHGRCMVETCSVLGFNKLFVRHTTSPKISPSARWPSSLNPQPGHLTAYLLEIILIIIPASTSSRHVRGRKKTKNNPSLKCVCLLLLFPS